MSTARSERICSTPAIPANLTAAITAVTELFNQFFTMLSGIIFPDTVTAVSVLASFGVIFPIIVVVLGFLFSLVRGRSGG